MGRQIEVVLSDPEEDEFLQFLRGSADVQLIRSFSPSKEALFVRELEPREEGHWTYYIWNKAFPWQPRVTTTRDGRLFYVENKSHAPVLEYSRHKVGATPPSPGRLYWAKSFSAPPTGVAYDVTAFERWYESLVRWVRKHRRRANYSVKWTAATCHAIFIRIVAAATYLKR
jgi:hypothetical protein